MVLRRISRSGDLDIGGSQVRKYREEYCSGSEYKLPSQVREMLTPDVQTASTFLVCSGIDT
jgi:hypothetical protein